jgi:hypothetical protein
LSSREEAKESSGAGGGLEDLAAGASTRDRWGVGRGVDGERVGDPSPIMEHVEGVGRAGGMVGLGSWEEGGRVG